MNTIPTDIYFNIFKHFGAETLGNAMLVSSEFNQVCTDKYIWNKAYHNTIPEKFINYGEDDFRLLLRKHLSILKHTEWFKRRLFMNFVYLKVRLNPASQVTAKEFREAFFVFSDGKFDSLPHNWYWECLDNESPDKANKLVEIAKQNEYVKHQYNGNYIHWDFPRDDDTIIKGLEIM